MSSEIIINSIGWYFISDNVSANLVDDQKTINDIVDQYKENSTDRLVIQDTVYYYNESWKNEDIFSSSDWKIEQSTKYLSGMFGFWVYVSSYTNEVKQNIISIN